ncbi:MAG: WecB/TagA/CpsF family glycosyltransferase [Firmicutes bacterium]|nr:WecB/TagA/CpsF family glycosyltransferase [Bacillota bacterium]
MSGGTILGLRVDNLTLTQAVEFLLAHCRGESQELLQVVTLNPEMVVRAQRDEKLAAVINSAGLVVPDGIGVVWGLGQLGTPVLERVPGVELVERILAQGAETLGRALRVFLLGAAPAVVPEAAQAVREKFSGVEVVGFHHGYFTPAEEKKIVQVISAQAPDLLLVGLGSPYQELWIDYHRNELKAKVGIGVGGTLDVLAGRVSRAPLGWRKLGLEWLYRLLQNPSRLSRMLALPRFVLMVMAEKYRKQR